MDALNEDEVKNIQAIASSNDHPVLMMNLNCYIPGEFPKGDLYKKWRETNSEMITNVGGKILWALPVGGYILSNGPAEPLDEILAYWYPSHASFLKMRDFDASKRNFEIRQSLIEHAIVHRCDGTTPPKIVGS